MPRIHWALSLTLITFILCLALSPYTFAKETEERGIPIHGEFCGPNIPTLEYTNKQDHILQLRRIAPIDTIDRSCKYHDICYVEKGYFDEGCDRKLIDEIHELLRSKTSDTSCIALSIAIIHYFTLSNPLRSSIENYAGTIMSGLAMQADNPGISTGALVYKMAHSAYLIGMSPLALLSGEIPPKVKDTIEELYKGNGIFDYYPNRDKECEFTDK
uniref:Uncharacterized protein n=1 Tax=Candidatus Kentrum sp. UNK TaxID=2126344 RepID=A0A451AM15_9GAMM|nr:MAG: hypothetical protein BECKUNK1418G_GA0071005_112410 [Candidatus Kentron sp. UNK]VFK72496.1 MAG: hypothetical protein BECKUNK1418H_GA0071006_11189 [Candidatus Kentron sp. UNK]